MEKGRSFVWLWALVPVAFIAWYVISAKGGRSLRHLPYVTAKGAPAGSRHVVPEFSFTDQDGQRVTEKETDGKVYVSEFFFTTCQSICPVMNGNLERVYARFRGRDDFLILSHTVDPGLDSVPVLKQYALSRGVKDRKWLFVTGAKKDLYRMARNGYLLGEPQTVSDEEDFVHTQNFALVDRKRQIRGIYDGTDSADVSKMMTDIETLLLE